MSAPSGYVIGVGLTIIGSICDAAGMVVERKGHLQVIDKNEINEIIEVDRKQTVWCHKIWLLGFFIYVVGSIINGVALKFAPQSVLAPLRSFTLVANAILATKILGEPFESNKIYGILLVIIGSVLSTLFGPAGSDEQLDLESLQDYWTDRVFLIFFGVWCGLILCDYVLLKVYEHKNWSSKTADHSKIEHGANFMLASYTAIAAFWAALSMLLMKSLMVVISSFDVKYFQSAFFYLTIVPFIPVNLLLEIFRQKALRHFEANFVVPIYQVLFVLGSIIMGGVFFQEFGNLTQTEYILFPTGIGITLIGVAILAYDAGAMFQEMLRTLNLKRQATLSKSRRSKALEHFTRDNDAETRDIFSAWGGIQGQITAEFIHSQHTLRFSSVSPKPVRMDTMDSLSPPSDDSRGTDRECDISGAEEDGLIV